MYPGRMTASSPTTTAPAAETHDHSHGSARWELWFAIAAGVTYAGGMIAEFALGLPMVGWPLVFFLATYFFGGFFTFRTAIASTMRGKFEVDFLMLVAAIGAASIGRFAEGAVLLARHDRAALAYIPGTVTGDEGAGYAGTDMLPLGRWEGESFSTYCSTFTGLSVHDVCIYGRGAIDGQTDFAEDNWWNKDFKNIFRPERNACYTHLNIVSNQAAISGQHNFINMLSRS